MVPKGTLFGNIAQVQIGQLLDFFEFVLKPPSELWHEISWDYCEKYRRND